MAYRTSLNFIVIALLAGVVPGTAIAQAPGAAPAAAAAPKKHTEIGMALKDKQAFVGKYSADNGAVITISLQGPRVVVEMKGQDQTYIYPEGPTTFFYKGVDAQIAFTLGKNGKASSLTLTQKGRSMTARRTGA